MNALNDLLTRQITFLSGIGLLIFLVSCNDDEMKNNQESEALNESNEFAACNSMINVCGTGRADYCLFGYKWGETPEFSPNGLGANGPEETGGIVTYSFQEEGGLANTHAQVDLPSQSFANILSCARAEIRNALSEWQNEANIEFQEMDDNGDSDIRFFVAEIRQSGVGLPNFQDPLCSLIGGDIIIQKDLWTNDCEVFRAFMLHEIGHVLGLGHVVTENIMNPEFTDLEVWGLQSGDIEGIQSIYGTN